MGWGGVKDGKWDGMGRMKATAMAIWCAMEGASK